jgi:hypothetical protein
MKFLEDETLHNNNRVLALDNWYTQIELANHALSVIVHIVDSIKNIFPFHDGNGSVLYQDTFNLPELSFLQFLEELPYQLISNGDEIESEHNNSESECSLSSRESRESEVMGRASGFKRKA